MMWTPMVDAEFIFKAIGDSWAELLLLRRLGALGDDCCSGSSPSMANGQLEGNTSIHDIHQIVYCELNREVS